MWLIVPMVYLLSWRSHRRFGQAFNETFAWSIGYLGTAGFILITDLGGVGMFSTRPTDPGAAVAIIGGFVAMYVSRIRWRRRGGHLESTENRWTRAFAAMRSGETTTAKPVKRKAAPGSSVAASRPASTATSPKPAAAATKQAAPARGPAQPSTAFRLGKAFRAMTNSEPPKKQTSKPAAIPPRAGTNTNTSAVAPAKRAATNPTPKPKPKTTSNRWVRAFGAMIDDGKGSKRSSQ